MRRPIDWLGIRAEYLSDAKLTLKAIAAKYNISEGSLRSRASRENWSRDRAAKATMLLKETAQKSMLDVVAELVGYNAEDLRLAKELRTLILGQLLSEGDDLTPTNIRSLAGAVESAQRVARIALGADIANNVPIKDELEFDLQVLTDVELAEFERLFNKARKRGPSLPGGSSVQ